MEIRKLKQEEINDVLEIIEEAKVYFRSINSPQWQNGYPNQSSIEQDYELGNAYVVADENKVVAYAAIIMGHDSNYDKIDGKWISEGPYGVMHRVCVKNEYKGQGLAHLLFTKMEEMIKERGWKSARIDTHELNANMIHCIGKEQFTKCGIVWMSDGSERLAFEKLI